MFKDRLTIIFNALSLGAILWAVLPLIFKFKSLPTQIPLWYTVPSAHRLAATQDLWLLPIIAGGCWSINFLLSWWLFRRYPAASQMLAGVSLVVAIIAAIAVTKIVLLYTNLL